MTETVTAMPMPSTFEQQKQVAANIFTASVPQFMAPMQQAAQLELCKQWSSVQSQKSILDRRALDLDVREELLNQREQQLQEMVRNMHMLQMQLNSMHNMLVSQATAVTTTGQNVMATAPASTAPATTATAAKVTAAKVTASTTTASTAPASTAPASTVTASIVTAATAPAATVTASIVTAATAPAATATADKVTASTATADKVTAATATADKVTAATATADKVTASTATALTAPASTVPATKVPASTATAATVAPGVDSYAMVVSRPTMFKQAKRNDIAAPIHANIQVEGILSMLSPKVRVNWEQCLKKMDSRVIHGAMKFFTESKDLPFSSRREFLKLTERNFVEMSSDLKQVVVTAKSLWQQTKDTNGCVRCILNYLFENRHTQHDDGMHRCRTCYGNEIHWAKKNEIRYNPAPYDLCHEETTCDERQRIIHEFNTSVVGTACVYCVWCGIKKWQHFECFRLAGATMLDPQTVHCMTVLVLEIVESGEFQFTNPHFMWFLLSLGPCFVAEVFSA
jgi:hypothetical protein